MAISMNCIPVCLLSPLLRGPQSHSKTSLCRSSHVSLGIAFPLYQSSLGKTMEEKGPGVTLNANMKVSGIVACKGV